MYLRKSDANAGIDFGRSPDDRPHPSVVTVEQLFQQTRLLLAHPRTLFGRLMRGKRLIGAGRELEKKFIGAKYIHQRNFLI